MTQIHELFSVSRRGGQSNSFHLAEPRCPNLAGFKRIDTVNGLQFCRITRPKFLLYRIRGKSSIGDYRCFDQRLSIVRMMRDFYAKGPLKSLCGGINYDKKTI